MIILNKPYVSDFLIETIKKNGFSVLDNEIARKYFTPGELTTTQKAIEKYNNTNELFYTNSENSIDWIAQNLSDSSLNKMISLSKDKALFRRTIQKIYPDYFFKEVSMDELKKIDPVTLNFPLILKPSVGFLSFGVYPIKTVSDWVLVIERLESDLKKLEGIFPKSVVNTKNFIIEDMIEGDEFALDAYFDNEGKAVVLNIFHHPFFDDNDVSDRAYYTSKEIIEKYLDKFTDTLNKIGKAGGYKNFPFHLELRANDKNIIPIEVNPLRFCGWCITDIANWAWGINVYEYFLKGLKPDWKNILKDDSIYYFTMGDIPSSINRAKISAIDFDKYLKNISNPLEIRKTDYKNNTVFAIVFAKTNSLDEIKNILKLDMTEFICVD